MAKPYVFNRHRRVIYKRNKIFLRSKLRLYCILKETNVKMLYVVYKTTTKKKKKTKLVGTVTNNFLEHNDLFLILHKKNQ